MQDPLVFYIYFCEGKLLMVITQVKASDMKKVPVNSTGPRLGKESLLPYDKL